MPAEIAGNIPRNEAENAPLAALEPGAHDGEYFTADSRDPFQLADQARAGQPAAQRGGRTEADGARDRAHPAETGIAGEWRGKRQLAAQGTAGAEPAHPATGRGFGRGRDRTAADLADCRARRT